MRTSGILGIIIVAVVSTGCSAGSLGSAGSVFVAPQSVHKVRASWIRPDAKKKWLLYVSDDGQGAVDIYNYKSKRGELEGQITGFNSPLGECTDAAGNVYVADFHGYQIYEFAHGGTTPVATAYDYYGPPTGCAVDPTTGNIAVTNTVTRSAPGNLLIFSGGLSGTQTVISGKNIDLDSFSPPAYDPSGNLFFEGGTYSAAASFVELPAGSGTLTLLHGLKIDETAGTQWDGSYIAAVDQNYKNESKTAIHRVTISGSSVKIVHTTILADTCGSGDYVSIYQPFIGGSKGKADTVVAGNLAVECSYRLDFWRYPKGGEPKRIMPAGIAPETPTGATLSAPNLP